MIYKAIAISLVCIGLAGCNVTKVLDQQVVASVGHPLPFVTPDEPEEDAAAPSVEPVVEPPVYVPPVTEPCNPGDFQFRVWSCDSTNHRSYI
jgi:hypothetical protein